MTLLECKILLEDRTCPGYSVSCTSCNLCKDDGVVHACAVCFTNSVGGGDLLKRKLFYCTWIFIYYANFCVIHKLFLSLDCRTPLEDRTLLEDMVTGVQAIADR